MTHLGNIPHILQKGITHLNSPNNNKDYISIGDKSLITKRESVILPNGFRLGAYIPFYFGPRMPMLFVIKQGANSIRYNIKSISSENIVYCITTVQQILMHKLEFIFSNGHAVNELTDFYDNSQIEEIHDLIDKKAISAKYWHDVNDLDLKRRKEAEFLIGNDIPIDAILGYAVYNLAAKQKLIEFGIEGIKIIVKPDYYFEQ